VKTSQNALVKAVAAANSRTVVVVSSPGAILLPWKDEVASVVANFMPGQQVGNAVVNVLFGDVNPSGKLPITFPNCENETALSPEQWPGVPQTLPETWSADPPRKGVATYSEELLVGYRYYDEHQIKFSTGTAFGTGLSYTSFAYSGLNLTQSEVCFDLANTGPVAGAEVAQLYVGYPEHTGYPSRQLRGFQKVALNPNETRRVCMHLRERDLSAWDDTRRAWALVKGSFRVYIGSSSRDIRLTSSIVV